MNWSTSPKGIVLFVLIPAISPLSHSHQAAVEDRVLRIIVGSVEVPPEAVAEIPVSAYSEVPICLIDLELSFDSTLISFGGVEDVLEGVEVAAQLSSDFGSPNQFFLSLKILCKEAAVLNGKLALVKFKLSQDSLGGSVISLEAAASAQDAAGSQAALQVEGGKITVVAPGRRTSADSVSAPASSGFSPAVAAGGFSRRWRHDAGCYSSIFAF
ncbi:MAG: hypothetical protein HY645_09230 [Acidobacteria bacterium]|nr:hypothetical protein [Acidobacteriota bacterium]